MIGEGSLCGSRARRFRAIEKCRGDQHAGQEQTNGSFMGEFLRAEFGIKTAEVCGFPIPQWTSEGAVGKLQYRLQMLRLGIQQHLLKFHRIVPDGGPDRFEPLITIWRIGTILRRVLPDLLKGIHERQGILADETLLTPEAVQLGLLCIVKHQAHEGFVLTVEECERDHLVDWDDFRIAEGSGKHLAEFFKSHLEAFASGAVFPGHDGGSEGDGGIAGGPCAVCAGQCSVAGFQAWGRGWFGGGYLQLHTAIPTGGCIECTGGRQFGTCENVGGQSHFHDCRGLHTEAGIVDFAAIGMAAKEFGINAPFGGNRNFRRSRTGGQP